MKRSTHRIRGQALRAGGRLNTYEVRRGWSNVNMIESAVHELAHLVCLGMPVPEKGHVSTIIGGRLGSDSRWCHWQEILALAAEVVVLRKLGLGMVGRWAVHEAAMRKDTSFSYRVFVQLVERASRTKMTKRRASHVRRLLDRFCEEGELRARP